MANIIGFYTNNGVEWLFVDSDPSASAGTVANIGSFAIVSSSGQMFRKYGAGNTQWEQVTTKIATLNTTDATFTTIDTIPIPTDTIVFLQTKIYARRTGGAAAGSVGDGLANVIWTRFKNIGGTVTEHNESAMSTSKDNATWDTRTAVSGTNAIIEVRGNLNTNLSWRSETILGVML